jgi:uncharacterized RDD family membrane protein YckC
MSHAHATTVAQAAAEPAGLLLALGAALYDALLVVAILFVATGAAVIVNGGEAIASHGVWFKLYLLICAFPYFAWCWTHSGQTLGMKTWRIELRRADAKPVRMRDAAVRYLVALLSWAALMFGYWWMLIDARQRSWHDLASTTRLVRLAPGAAAHTGPPSSPTDC